MPSYYRVLGVSRFADLREIRSAYWSLSRRISRECEARSRDSHLTEIRRAFEALSSSALRRAYDAGQSDGAEICPRPADAPPGSLRGDDFVAREFPSMSRLAGITPRVYAAFFGKDPAAPRTHAADVALTQAEACKGTRVPLALSVRPVCPVCGGRGELWPEPCGVCLGTGAGFLSHELQITVPPGVRDGDSLRYTVIPPFSPETQIELRIAIH